MRILSIIFILFFAVNQLFAQEEYSTKSKKAIGFFESAMQKYNSRLDVDALADLDNALKIDSNFIEAVIFKANICHDNKKYKDEIQNYYRAIRIDSTFSNKTYFFVADAELLIGQYKNSIQNFEKFLKFPKISNSLKIEAQEKLEKAKYGLKSYSNPVDFVPINLGEAINTKYDEYWPSLTADEQSLIFTRQIPSNPNEVVTNNGMQEDFYVSNTNKNMWSTAVNLGFPINTNNNEGALCVSSDGLYLFYTVCNRAEDFGSCDIYYSKKSGNNWSKPQNAGEPVNSAFWESNPSFSSDGRTLYFVSNRIGGKGKMDVWAVKIYSEQNGKILWTKPMNLGDSINTLENEAAPFIHADNKTLYFSSDGHLGLGQMDVFYSKKDSLGMWHKPKNIGYPINTFSDERGIIVNAKGDYAYFASNRGEGNGLDIYGFDLYEGARPIFVTYVKGFIYDSISKQRLSAKFELMDLETSKTIISSNSNSENGEYLVCLPVNADYAFNASKDGYMFYSENFSLKGITDLSKPFELNIPLIPIKKDVKIVLKNIFYDTNKFSLKKESTAELQKLVDFMKSNSKVKIEISGHTDNVGSEIYNQTLSENRAKTVYEYLIANGIEATRISYKGYNFTQPIASNETEAGRAENRRTEFKIVSVE